MIVTFNIADGSFEFYTNEKWATQIKEWHRELVLSGHAESDLDAYSSEEIVELMWGEEMFFGERTVATRKSS
jgi:hypothetical protein